MTEHINLKLDGFGTDHLRIIKGVKRITRVPNEVIYEQTTPPDHYDHRFKLTQRVIPGFALIWHGGKLFKRTAELFKALIMMIELIKNRLRYK
jgi:hypothetical protein